MIKKTSEEQKISATHRYASISPSAKSLLLMKSLTDIPYARQAAKIMMGPFDPEAAGKGAGFFARLVHFENRYWSIDQLLSGLNITNIIELSSGYSFRGLDMVQHLDVHYIDTDLPEVAAIKTELAAELHKGAPGAKGLLEILPLNALDENEFNTIVNRFSEGKIVIVNEGLLVYLGEEEKQKLCSIIHRILERWGGYWITADVYIRKDLPHLELIRDDTEKKFSDAHRIEENKFESFEAARFFFEKAGFFIEKEAEPDRSKLSSMKYLLRSATKEQLSATAKAGRIQATWMLKAF